MSNMSLVLFWTEQVDVSYLLFRFLFGLICLDVHVLLVDDGSFSLFFLLLLVEEHPLFSIVTGVSLAFLSSELFCCIDFSSWILFRMSSLPAYNIKNKYRQKY
jgi:hypothetical protein